MRSAAGFAFVLLAACGEAKPSKQPVATTPATTPAPNGEWDVPTGWRSEVIKFPLDFAPTLDHMGHEELRFPPGFFDPASGEYWSYAFIWRTRDSAQLDAKALGDELTVYFRGLVEAVDDKKRITARDQIVATAEDAGERFRVRAYVFDAFKTAQPVELFGWAERRPCGTGALWIFVLAPKASTIREQLDALAMRAACVERVN